jgi:hypothetical protein
MKIYRVKISECILYIVYCVSHAFIIRPILAILASYVRLEILHLSSLSYSSLISFLLNIYYASRIICTLLLSINRENILFVCKC